MYPYIAPENFDNSSIKSITNEQLTIKIDDLIKQKEVTKYITDKEKLISIIKTSCEFMKISDDNQSFEYNLPENMTVFSILNIPLKMNKEEVKQNIELINLQYNRLYKKGFYWVLSTTDKETVICMQNSLRDLNFDESKVKYDLYNRNQILHSIKEQVEKTLYQKEAKNLGIPSGKNKNNYKAKASDTDSEAFSWRKGSCEGKPSFDVNENKNFKKNNNYYNKNNNQKKRNRFNSDNAGQKYNNYENNYNSNHNNYNNYNYNNYHNNYRNNNNSNQIEIDISNLKYPIHIKYKYSFSDIKSFYQKICDNNLLSEKPQYLSNIFDEIISDKKKDIVVLDELIESSKQLSELNNNKPNEKEEKDEKINTNIKIPKKNPLSNMGKGFNNQKFK